MIDSVHNKNLLKKWLLAATIVLLVLLSSYLIVSFVSEFFYGAGYFHGRHYDFLAFFSTSHLTLQGNISQIYDASVLTNFERTIVPHPVSALGYMPFLNPPFLAVLISPLALLHVNDARLIWMLLNLSLMLVLAFMLTKSITHKYLRLLYIFLIICSYPVFQNLLQGQISIIILAGSLFSLWAYERKNYVLSGALLSVLAIKPQLALFVGIGLLLCKQWRMVRGMILATLGLILVTLPFTPINLYATYINFSSAVASGHFNGAGTLEPAAWQGSLSYAFGLNGMYTSLFGQTNVLLVNIFTFASAGILIALLLYLCSRQKPGLNSFNGRLVLVASLVVVMLINPHAYAHDLILAFVIAAILMPLKHSAYVLAGFLTFLVLSFIDDKYGLHFTTLVLLAFFVYIYLRVINQKKFVVKKSSHK